MFVYILMMLSIEPHLRLQYTAASNQEQLLELNLQEDGKHKTPTRSTN
jgi:hypothetical protein